MLRNSGTRLSGLVTESSQSSRKFDAAVCHPLSPDRCCRPCHSQAVNVAALPEAGLRLLGGARGGGISFAAQGVNLGLLGLVVVIGTENLRLTNGLVEKRTQEIISEFHVDPYATLVHPVSGAVPYVEVDDEAAGRRLRWCTGVKNIDKLRKWTAAYESPTASLGHLIHDCVLKLVVQQLLAQHVELAEHGEDLRQASGAAAPVAPIQPGEIVGEQRGGVVREQDHLVFALTPFLAECGVEESRARADESLMDVVHALLGTLSDGDFHRLTLQTGIRSAAVMWLGRICTTHVSGSSRSWRVYTPSVAMAAGGICG